MVQDDVEHAEADLEGASHHCLAHGSLLSLRYVLAEVPWEALAPRSHHNPSGFKSLLQQLTKLIKRVAGLTLPVLALYQETYLGNHPFSTVKNFQYIICCRMGQKYYISQVQGSCALSLVCIWNVSPWCTSRSWCQYETCPI